MAQRREQRKKEAAEKHRLMECDNSRPSKKQAGQATTELREALAFQADLVARGLIPHPSQRKAGNVSAPANALHQEQNYCGVLQHLMIVIRQQNDVIHRRVAASPDVALPMPPLPTSPVVTSRL